MRNAEKDPLDIRGPSQFLCSSSHKHCGRRIQEVLDFATGFSSRRSLSLSLFAKKSRSMGRVAGPRFTFPSTSNSLPWHGHSKSFNSGFHRCRHPRCVQRSSNAITCSPTSRLTSQQPASGTCIGTFGRSLSRISSGISRRLGLSLF